MFEFLLKTPLKNQWKKIGLKKRAGVIFPLFSVFSKKSLGIGEISDLKLAIDWSKKTGNTILQILPINDTGFDFSPFNPQSSFALDPIYLSLWDLISIKKENLERELKDLAEKFPLNKKYVNYQIKRAKIEKLWSIFLRRASFPKRFENFVKRNNYWLEDYSLFRVLKEYFKEKFWEEWPEKFKNRDIKSLREFEKKNQEKIKFQKWLQWQLFEQLRKIKIYAQEKLIFFKGDLPLFVSRDSSDCWSKRKYFKLNFSAGAPPDLFSEKGQRWGMPTYNWEEIFKDDFIYFKERLKYAQNFYHLFRIDHLVGIFRTWSIPIETPFKFQGKKGLFDPKDENLWIEQGRKILNLIIKSTKMLPCAEDLGTVPHFCYKILEDLGIPGIDVQRWKKDWQNFNFLKPDQYRPISVSTLSTHDLNLFPIWFEEIGTVSKGIFKKKCLEKKIDFEKIRNKIFSSEKKGRLFWKNSLNKNKLIKILNRPEKEILDLIKIFKKTFKEKEKFLEMISSKKELIKKNLILINSTNSIFCILLIFEWLFLSDILKGRAWRINFPGKISKKNFSLRLPISLENLINLKINNQIREIIQKSGRI